MGTQGSGPEFRLGGPGQLVVETALEPGRHRAEQEIRSGFRAEAKAGSMGQVPGTDTCFF